MSQTMNVANKMESNTTPMPELHDAELYAVRHDPWSSTVECIFRTVDGHDLTLLLTDVEKFRCSDFGLQNVVLELTVIDSAQRPMQDELRGRLEWMSGTSDGESLSSEQEVEAAVQHVLNGKYVLVSLVPSWGAQVCALAKGVVWSIF
jgi:hypothetical protein